MTTDKKPDNNALYDSEAEKMQHQRAIQALAMQFGISPDDIEKRYAAVLKDFKNTARIKDFLAVLVSRKVSELLIHDKNNKRNAA